MQGQTFEFPVGYHKLHNTKIMDFQLNRWHSWGYLRLEDLRQSIQHIRTLEDWKPEMTRQAEKAKSEGRMTEAAFFYRSAEFFVLPTDPDKQILYDTFRDIFYGHVFDAHRAERIEVPYEGTHLPVLHFRAQGHESRGTIVAHGGFDSFMEELYAMCLWFSDGGFEVVLFEGPGQGAALKKHGLTLTHEWERPAKAVLDYFNLDDVTWLGISLGGWLCFRAAAFEQRITRLIASSIAFDYLQMIAPPLQWLVRTLLHYPKAMNKMAKLKARIRAQERWGLNNMMYLFGAETPSEAIEKFLEFNERNQHADLVRQDVLILTGKEDRFVPLKMHAMQIRALNSARSVTGRIFTAEEHGQNHCQIGNVELALQEMVKWISSLENTEPDKVEVA